MTLKDWKKTEDSKIHVTYWNIKNPQPAVGYNKNKLSMAFGDKRYRADFGGKENFFKTKSQMINATKRFMRNH